mgnify:CR=1 FL=1
MTFRNHNYIMGLFYDKLVDAVSPVPVKAQPTDKLTSIPHVILNWLTTTTYNWGGFGGHVLNDTLDCAIIILAKDRSSVDEIAQDLRQNLLNLGSLSVDITATPMQKVFIRPGTFTYVMERDDAVQLVWTGSLQFTYE